jgi:hypothetical protein
LEGACSEFCISDLQSSSLLLFIFQLDRARGVCSVCNNSHPISGNCTTAKHVGYSHYLCHQDPVLRSAIAPSVKLGNQSLVVPDSNLIVIKGGSHLMSDDEFHSADEEIDDLSSTDEGSEAQVKLREAPTRDTPITSSPDPTQSVTLNSSEAVATDGSKTEEEGVEIEPAVLHWESSPAIVDPPDEESFLESGNNGLADPPAVVAAVTEHWARPIASRPTSAAHVASQRVEPVLIAQTHQRVETPNNGGDKGVEQPRPSSAPADRRGSLDEAHDAIRLMQGCLGAPWPSHEDDTNDLPPLPAPSTSPSLPSPRAPSPAPIEPLHHTSGPPGGAIQSIGGVTREAVIARLNAAKAAKAGAIEEVDKAGRHIVLGVEARVYPAGEGTGTRAATTTHEASSLSVPNTYDATAVARSASSAATAASAPTTARLPQKTTASKVALVRAITVPK